MRSYQVESIHCEGCVARIRNALGSIEGIGEVSPDQATNQVTVDFDDSKVDDQRIRSALADAGFPVVGAVEAPSTDATRRNESRDEPEQGAGEDERGFRRYAVLVVAIVLIAIAGYIGYVLYPRFDLPAVQGAGLLGLAAAAGIASFFSPCSFPLLVGLLGRQAVAQSRSGETAKPAMFGGALALGAAVFMLLAGVVIALGGEALFAGVTFTSTAGITIRTIVGLLLILLGLIQTGILPLSLHAVSSAAQPISRAQARLRREHPVAGFGIFGFGYVLAGFG